VNANAGELLETMRVRLKMQREGTTNPAAGVKADTRALVEKLSEIDSAEEIQTLHGGRLLARYVRVSTGDVLAEIYDE